MKRIATTDTGFDPEASANLQSLKTYSRDVPHAAAPNDQEGTQGDVLFVATFVNSASKQDYRQFETPAERESWLVENAASVQRQHLLTVPRLASAEEVSLLIAARDL